MSFPIPSGLRPTSKNARHWSTLRLPRRIKTALASLLALVLFYIVYHLLPSPGGRSPFSSFSNAPNPFHTPGELIYDRENPFITTFRPSNGARPPRLMEKLVKRLRGAEQLVFDAAERARLLRIERQREARSLGGAVEDAEAFFEEEERAEDFEWLRGRTILLLGDSLDRYHLLHLCQFLAPQSPLVPLAWPHADVNSFVTIHPLTSPAYPSALRDLEEELVAKHRGGNPFSTPTYRPWTCEIKEFDAMIVWVFMNGLDDGETTPGVQEYGEEPTEVTDDELVGKQGTWGDRAKVLPFGDRAYWSVDSEHFNPPLRSEDRLNQLVLPLLANLGRGGPRNVDMVELGIGAWDLMMFKNQDAQSAANHLASLPSTYHTSPAPPSLTDLSVTLSSSPLSPLRLAWYASRLSSLLATLVRIFPPTSRTRFGPISPRISVRHMVCTPQHYGWPYLQVESRIVQIENEARRVVREVNVQAMREEFEMFDDGHGEDPSGRKKPGGMRGKSRRGRGVRVRDSVRWNDWAEIVKGNGEWLDHVHPGPIPSWIWADSTLYELRKLVTGRA